MQKGAISRRRKRASLQNVVYKPNIEVRTDKNTTQTEKGEKSLMLWKQKNPVHNINF